MNILTLAIPSKGRLMEQAAAVLEAAGLSIERSGTERGYRGQLKGIDDVEVAFLSAAEIAQNLREGKIDFGITGADLLWEKSAPQENLVSVLAPLNFGFANVVVAVPECWLDVASMADLDEVSESFYLRHGRRLRIATKYLNLTRRFFAEKGVTGGCNVNDHVRRSGSGRALGCAQAFDDAVSGHTLFGKEPSGEV